MIFRLPVCEASVTIIVKLIAVFGHVSNISDAKKRAGKRGGGAWPGTGANGPWVPSGK